ncbi:hypothetical protein M885DRAFT_512393 [Pelagophyceae sp. CCMP2097]|nr:hypothetical protein M885DRAFT_512393 [Pelagophyceae sp. CCMP2097]
MRYAFGLVVWASFAMAVKGPGQLKREKAEAAHAALLKRYDAAFGPLSTANVVARWAAERRRMNATVFSSMNATVFSSKNACGEPTFGNLCCDGKHKYDGAALKIDGTTWNGSWTLSEKRNASWRDYSIKHGSWDAAEAHFRAGEGAASFSRRPGLRWVWTPATPECALKPMESRKDVCSVLESRRVRRILFVGDSLCNEWACAFLATVGDEAMSAAVCDGISLGHLGVPLRSPKSEAASACFGKVRVGFVRMDRVDADRLVRVCADFGVDTLILLPFNHYVKVTCATPQGCLDRFRSDLHKVGEWLRRVGRWETYVGLGHLGHPDCPQFTGTQPISWSDFEAKYASSGYWAARSKHEEVRDWFWHIRSAQNCIVRRVFAETAHLVDTAAVANLRPDEHLDRRWTGKEINDCLHYFVPGIPDTWADLLLTKIANGHCDVHHETAPELAENADKATLNKSRDSDPCGVAP